MARILIVDHEPAERDRVRQALDATGHELAEAAGGREAFARVEREPFDCAIVSVFMPDMDGIETLRALKALRPELPVLNLAGEGVLSAETTCRLARVLGADGVLTKPVEPAPLQAMLDALLTATGPGDAWPGSRESRGEN